MAKPPRSESEIDNSSHLDQSPPEKPAVVPIAERPKPEQPPIPEGVANGTRVVILCDHVYVAPTGDNYDTYKVVRGWKGRLPKDQAEMLISSGRATTLD